MWVCEKKIFFFWQSIIMTLSEKKIFLTKMVWLWRNSNLYFAHFQKKNAFRNFFQQKQLLLERTVRVSSEIFWELILLSKHILWCQSTFWYKISTIKSKTTTQEKTFFFQFLIPKIWKLNFFFFAILRFLLKKHGKSLPKTMREILNFFEKWKIRITFKIIFLPFDIIFDPKIHFGALKELMLRLKIFFIFWHFHPHIWKQNS